MIIYSPAYFMAGFHLIVCGLDSIVARRWINGMVVCTLILSIINYILVSVVFVCQDLLYIPKSAFFL